MNTSTITASAESAREAARETSGKFGAQDHADPGLVEQTPPLSMDPDEILRHVDGDIDEDEFPGYGEHGDDFQRQVEVIRNAIWDAPRSPEWEELKAAGEEREFAVEFPRDSDADGCESMVGFVIRKGGRSLRVMRFVEFRDLTSDRRAVGREAARAIAATLIEHMDGAQSEFEALR